MKAAKIAIIVIAPIALIIGLVVVFGGGSKGIPGSLPYVDVATGKMLNRDPQSFIALPGKNADGQRAIFPVEENEAGEMVIGNRYRSALIELAKTMDVKVNLDTFEIEQ